MKRYVALSLAAVLTMNTLVAKDMKIAKIEPTNIIIKSDKWAKLGETAKVELEKRSAELQKKQVALQKEAKKLESMGAAASKDAVQNTNEKIAKLRSDMEIEYQSLQAYEQRMSQEAQMAIVKDIEEATDQILAENDYDMVVAGGVIACKKEYDITDKVLARVNANYIAQQKKSDAVAKVAKAEPKKADAKA